MADDSNFTPPPKTILDNPKFRMDGDKLDGAKRRSQLSFELWKNNPRIAIYYNDERNKPTYARMEIDSFFLFLSQMAEIAKGTSENSPQTVKIKNKHNYDPQGNKLPQPMVVSQTVGGIDEATGRMFVAVVEKDKPALKFFFDTNFWYDIVDGSNTPIDAAILSKAICLAKMRTLQTVYPIVMAREYVHPQPRQGGGGGGGNWNKKSGGGGGNWNQNKSQGQPQQAPATAGMFDDIAL